jgi:hypothetical protein
MPPIVSIGGTRDPKGGKGTAELRRREAMARTVVQRLGILCLPELERLRTAAQRLVRDQHERMPLHQNKP